MCHTTDLYRRFQFEEDGLIDEDFTGLCAQETDLVLLQLNLLAWSIASDCYWEMSRSAVSPRQGSPDEVTDQGLDSAMPAGYCAAYSLTAQSSHAASQLSILALLAPATRFPRPSWCSGSPSSRRSMTESKSMSCDASAISSRRTAYLDAGGCLLDLVAGAAWRDLFARRFFEDLSRGQTAAQSADQKLVRCTPSAAAGLRVPFVQRCSFWRCFAKPASSPLGLFNCFDEFHRAAARLPRYAEFR